MGRVGILLAGCGPLDGSDPVAALAAAFAVVEAEGEAIAFAPDRPQRDGFDSITGEALPETRRCLPESARIFRGHCRSLATITVDHLDALFIGGGLGVVKTLCDIAIEGSEKAVLLPECQDLIQGLVAAGKPLGSVCEGTILLATALRDSSLRLAISPDPLLRDSVEAFGHEAVVAPPAQLVFNETPRVVTAAGTTGSDLRGAELSARAVVGQLMDWSAEAE